MPWVVYDFTDENGASVIGEWLRADGISKLDIAKFKEKLTTLRQYGPNVGGSLLAGPIYRNIYKLRINTAERALRPLLCIGPFDNETAFTLLLGACEINSQLPYGSEQRADTNRTTLLANPTRRRRR